MIISKILINQIVIANHLSISTTKKGKKVSELLKEYYLQENNCNLISRRISLFGKIIGLGEQFENEEAFIKRYQHEITDSALLYLINKYGNKYFLYLPYGSILSIAKLNRDEFLNMKYGTYILKIFINSLKKCS